MADLKKIKITHSVNYKGVAIKAGTEAEFDTATADRLIAAGNAVEVAEKAEKPAKSAKK